MNCKDVKTSMIDYLSNDDIPQEMKEHFSHCKTCKAEFEQLQRLMQTLKPKIEIKTSENFTNNIIHKLNMEDKKMKKRIPFWTKIAAVLALALLTSTLLTVLLNRNSNYQVSAHPANQVFAESIIAFSKNKSMRMEMKIRTLKGDNFELIGTEYGFVKYRIKVDFSSPKKWIIEKPRRRALCDGKNQYLDIQGFDFVIKTDTNAGFVGWLSLFFMPDRILEIEKERSEKDKSNYTVKETKEQLILTVYSKAQGDFTNDYMKNSSVSESDNKREFCFDKKTHQLQSFNLYIVKGKKEILVMKTTKIEYDEEFDAQEFDVQIFGNKKIKNAEDLNPQADKELKAKTPEEIARYFFEACASSDWEKVEKVYPYISAKTKDYLSGLQVVEIGKSFKSGQYPGYFVPYTIKLKSVYTKTFNLAVRNDNYEKMWMVDGGI
jgi:hypothetical protein